jgi:osmotically-inducible protein OsmY
VARYHFNIRNGTGFTADDEGMDLSSEADARSHAIEGARSLISAEVLQGTLDLNGQIEVTDEGQGAVMRCVLSKPCGSSRPLLGSRRRDDLSG